MRLHSPQFEGRLRRGIRSAIRASPALRKEARQRGRARTRNLPISNWVARLLISGWLLMLLAGRAFAPPFPAYPLAVLNLWTVFLCLAQAHALASRLYGDSELVRFAFLPAPGPIIFRWQAQVFVQRSLGVWLDGLAGFGYLAYAMDASTGAWVTVPLLAAAHWFLVLAVAAIFVAHPAIPLRWGRPVMWMIGGALILLTLDDEYVGPYLASWLAASSHWLTLLLPTGWLPNLFHDIAAQHRWLSLLLLGPLALIGMFGLRSSKSLFHRYAPESIEYSMVEGGHEDAAEESSRSASWRRPGLTEVEESIRGRAFLGAWIWREQGLLEGLVRRWLTARENLIVEVTRPGAPTWSRQWFKACVGLTIGGMVTWSLQRLGAGWYGWVDGFILAIGALLTLSTGIRINARLAGGLPIGFSEVARLKQKIALIRAGSALPLLVGYGAALAWRLGFPVMMGVSLGFKALLLYLAVVPLDMVFDISSGTNDTKDLRLRSMGMILTLIILGGAILGLAVGAVISEFSAGSAWKSWLCLVGVAAASRLLLAYYRRQFSRCRFDLVP